MLSDCPESTYLKDFCNSFNLLQLISQPTRVTLNSSTLLDVILTTNSHLVIQSAVICTDISNHFPVITTLNLRAPKSQVTTVMTRSYKNYDPAVLCKDVSMIPWDTLSICDEVDDNLLVGEMVENHAPIKEMTFKYKGNPCITPAIKGEMKIKSKRKEQEPLNWIAIGCF